MYTTEQQRLREQEFFKWFEQIEKIMNDHDVPAHQIVNVRQVWDIAFSTGYSLGIIKAADIALNTND